MSIEPMVETNLDPMAPITKRWAAVNFEGSLDECFRHFIVNHPHRDDRLAFGKLVGAKDIAVRRWWGSHHFPTGLRQLRVRYVLEWYGYMVLDRLVGNAIASQFAKSVAYGILTQKDAMGLLDIQAGQLRRVLTGRTGTSVAATDMMRTYVEESTQVLADFEARIFGERPTRPTVMIKQAAAGLTKPDTLATGAHLIKALLPVVQIILSDDFSPEDREELRIMAGKYSVFNLKNALVRLCGERARRVHEDDNAE